MKREHYQKTVGLVIILLIIFSIRILFLDSDVPYWGIINYQPIDEGAYSYLALNKINYGVINPDIKFPEVNQYTGEHVRTNFIGNLFSYLGVKCFGDNYYGLRMGSIFCMLINLFLIYYIFLQLHKKYHSNDKVNLNPVFFLFYILFEFTFFVASRINETSIYRMLFLLLSYALFIKLNKSYVIRFFLLGFISVFSVFGIYITNIFLVIAILATIVCIYFWSDIKKGVCATISFGIGSSVAYFLCDIYFRVFWDCTLIENTTSVIGAFSGIAEYQTTRTFWDVFRIVIEFFSNNFALYNIGIFLLILIFIPILLYYMFRQKDYNILMSFFILGAFLCQTLFSEDFIRRKFIIVAPICYILLYIIFLTKDTVNLKIPMFLKYAYICVCFLGAEGVLIFRLFIVHDNTRNDFSKTTIWILILLGTLINLFIIFYVFSADLKIKKSFLLLAIILSIFNNCYMIYTTIYQHPTFSEKHIMEELDNLKLENKHIVGTYALGYTLYNKYIPVLNSYEGMKNILIKHPEYYYFDYSIKNNEGVQKHIEGILKNTDYYLKEIHTFSREFQTFGEKRKMALYKVEKREKEKENEKN